MQCDRDRIGTDRQLMGIGVTVARLTLNQLVKVRILDPQLKAPRDPLTRGFFPETPHETGLTATL